MHNASKSKYGKGETFVRYCSEEEAIKSKKAQNLVPKEHNGTATRDSKWISELKNSRFSSLSKKGHEYEMIIKTDSGALDWMKEHSFLAEKTAEESKLTGYVIIKNNEPGSYGIGVDLLQDFKKRFKPLITYRRIK